MKQKTNDNYLLDVNKNTLFFNIVVITVFLIMTLLHLVVPKFVSNYSIAVILMIYIFRLNGLFSILFNFVYLIQLYYFGVISRAKPIKFNKATTIEDFRLGLLYMKINIVLAVITFAY